MVGDLNDPHVRAVAERATVELTVLDAAGLASNPFTITTEGLNWLGQDIQPGRGWIRRLAPAGWMEHPNEGSLEGAVREAYLSALAAILRHPGMHWLTDIETLGLAENKIVQYRLAASAGCAVPPWLVTTDPMAVPRVGKWVSKPLGPGHFIESGCGRVVPTTSFHASQRDAVAGAPFILQAQVDARVHARVVTVGSLAVSATLQAKGLPIDWRTEPTAHTSFHPEPAPPAVHRSALALAARCGVGYSSQDWLQDADACWWFIDLNPAGQWLFLPESVTERVSMAIAEWLSGGSA